jgi:hypothetical protein
MDAWRPKHVEDYHTIKRLWKLKCIKLVTLLWCMLRYLPSAFNVASTNNWRSRAKCRLRFRLRFRPRQTVAEWQLHGNFKFYVSVIYWLKRVHWFLWESLVQIILASTAYKKLQLQEHNKNTVCSLLGGSPACEFYMPTFRNAISSIFIHG